MVISVSENDASILLLLKVAICWVPCGAKSTCQPKYTRTRRRQVQIKKLFFPCDQNEYSTVADNVDL